VTHPFHPRAGRAFVFVAVRQTWGQDRVFVFDDDGTQWSIPRAWTDMRDEDPIVTVAAGRSPFRVVDLIALSELLDGPCLADDAPVL
jgi:Family of unknown function (DUF5372)